MIKEITLPCGAKMFVKEFRTKTQAETSSSPNWPTFASVLFETEGTGFDEDGEELEIVKVELPIQLRSIDKLVESLIWLKEELLK